MKGRKQAAPSKPHLTDEYEPTNERLWQSVLDVARGTKQQLTLGGRTINSPNEGKGFYPWPQPNAMAWAVKQYNGFGGGWRRKASTTLSLMARGAVLTTKVATADHQRMQEFQAHGLVRLTKSGVWHYWDITAKGAQVVKALHRTQG